MMCDENEGLYVEVTFRCKLKDEDQFSRKKKNGKELIWEEQNCAKLWNGEGNCYDKEKARKII